MGFSILNIVIIVGALVAGIGSTLYFKMKKDNPVEEIAEEVIKQKTGFDIDLSPGTPEKSKKDKKDKDKK